MLGSSQHVVKSVLSKEWGKSQHIVLFRGNKVVFEIMKRSRRGTGTLDSSQFHQLLRRDEEHPLKMEVIQQMLNIEESILNHKLTKESFELLLDIYQKCVGYYASIHDPIKHYFMEKIQLTMSNPAVLDLIIEGNLQAHEKPVKRRQTMTNLKSLKDAKMPSRKTTSRFPLTQI